MPQWRSCQMAFRRCTRIPTADFGTTYIAFAPSSSSSAPPSPRVSAFHRGALRIVLNRERTSKPRSS